MGWVPKGDVSPATDGETPHGVCYTPIEYTGEPLRFAAIPRCQSVTTDQNGPEPVDHDVQFVAEGADVKPHPGRRKLREALERASMQAGEAENVNAVQVSMDRSGAEHIEARRVTLDHSGAKSLSAESAELTDSGVLHLSGGNLTLNHSSAIIANGQSIRLNESRAIVVAAGETVIENGGMIGMLTTGTVEATGDVNATFLFGGEVKAGGDVNVSFDALSAGVLGMAIGAGLGLVIKFVRR